MVNDITTRTAEKKEADIHYLMSLPLKELRKRQGIIKMQWRDAFDQCMRDKDSQFQHVRENADIKWNPIFQKLDYMANDLIEAIDRKCFPQVLPSPQSRGKKKK
jgi:hypothetical protein